VFLIFLLDDWDIDHTAPIRGLVLATYQPSLHFLMSYQQILLRSALDDFNVMLTAQGMEDAGATVISVFPVRDLFQVLCSYDPEKSTPDDIDERIGQQIDIHHNKHVDRMV